LERQKSDDTLESTGADAASLQKWTSGCLAVTTGGVAFVTMVPLLKDLKQDPGDLKPSWNNTILVLVDWLMCACKLKKDQEFTRTASTFFPVVPICMGLCSAYSVRQFFFARAQQVKHEQMKRHVSSNTEFVRANEEMWEGMRQLVDALWDKVEYFKDLNKERKERVCETLNTIGRKTFNMVMSVDIYLLWMERHQIFPPNVTMSVMMGQEKYQAIHDTLNPKRGWFGRSS